MNKYALLAVGLLAGSAHACDVSLIWSEPAQDAGVVIPKISAYNVNRCTKADCSDAVYVAQVGPTVFSFTDTARPTGQWYYYVQRITSQPDQVSNIVLKKCSNPKPPVLSDHAPTRPKRVLFG